MLKMEESGSHQLTIEPHQGNDNPHQVELEGSQRHNLVVKLNKGEVVRKVCKQRILIRVCHVERVMFPM